MRKAPSESSAENYETAYKLLSLTGSYSIRGVRELTFRVGSGMAELVYRGLGVRVATEW